MRVRRVFALCYGADVPSPARSAPRAPLAPSVRRILGVDPGTRVTGWGVVEVSGNRSRLVACGAVRTAGPSLAGRLREVHVALRDVASLHSPGVLAVERPFFGKNASSALAVGMARGTAFLVAAEAGIDVREYPPATVKRAVVGNGAASKEQVSRMVSLLLGLAKAPEPADATVALAVALADAHRAALRGIDASGESE
jgi:crossover junction endodeoxyribonuclease RuvC